MGASASPAEADGAAAAAADELGEPPREQAGRTTSAWPRWPNEDPSLRARQAAAPGTADGEAGVSAAGGLPALLRLFGLRGGFPARVALALVGWPAIGIAVSTFAGEVTGCGRFAAGCVELFGVGTWLAQLAIIAILLALPAVAALSAAGTLAALAASVPTAVVLSATGGSKEPGASAAILGAVLALAYVAGVVFAIVRRTRYGRVP
jgi:hypothetical protein